MDTRFAWRPDATFDTPAIVIVDVLSFTTAVTIGAARLATMVPSGEPTTRRGRLSPTTMRDAPLPDPPAITLASPNGSALAAGIPASITLLAGCLRNARAVGAWLIAHDYETVTVIAAGEHWPSGRWRRCAEDYLGAGAVLHALGSEDTVARAWARHGDHAARHLRDSISGRELRARGYDDDVTLAGEFDADDVVPLRIDGAFRAATERPSDLTT